MAEDSELFKRAIAYCESTGIGLNMEQRLGYGTDGTVWESSANSAVKAVKRWKNYDVERESYRRLRDHGVTELAGFAIPSLIGFDDSLMVIEMDIVNPPYLIDFGKVYLDAPPPTGTTRKCAAMLTRNGGSASMTAGRTSLVCCECLRSTAFTTLIHGRRTSTPATRRSAPTLARASAPFWANEINSWPISSFDQQLPP